MREERSNNGGRLVVCVYRHRRMDGTHAEIEAKEESWEQCEQAYNLQTGQCSRKDLVVISCNKKKTGYLLWDVEGSITLA
jgi:hypothetical protein